MFTYSHVIFNLNIKIIIYLRQSMAASFLKFVDHTPGKTTLKG